MGRACQPAEQSLLAWGNEKSIDGSPGSCELWLPSMLDVIPNGRRNPGTTVRVPTPRSDPRNRPYRMNPVFPTWFCPYLSWL